MLFCIGGKYRQVGGGTPRAALVGVNLVRIHAVRVLPDGLAGGTVCGQTYDRLDAAAGAAPGAKPNIRRGIRLDEPR